MSLEITSSQRVVVCSPVGPQLKCLCSKTSINRQRRDQGRDGQQKSLNTYVRGSEIMLLYEGKSLTGLRVECRHHLQSVCLQDVVLVDQTDEDSFGRSLVGQCYSIHLRAHLFGPLKQHLGSKHFADDDDVLHEVLLWMRQQPQNFMQLELRRW
ncbi:hypothetical protein AVEN_196384-1 [Araneus ventricosus]|uniref:Uncharacterized protein n=1 Tax=Araneus ventricosus TaxID=182803 RepID=A0A4Y2AXF5_ARAVE|nr:hypothetical protein AVEN_196384-1 [Araneus ventricosus]